MANRTKSKRREQRRKATWKATRKATRKAMRKRSMRKATGKATLRGGSDFKRFNKMRGGLRLGYLNRQYNDTSENDENTRTLLRQNMETFPQYYGTLTPEQKTQMINNTIEALRNLMGNSLHYFGIEGNLEHKYPRVMYRGSLEETLFPLPPPPPPTVYTVLSSIPVPNNYSQTIVIDYEMIDHTKNFYISERENVFETLFEKREFFINKKPFFKYFNRSSTPPAYDEGTDFGGLTTHVFSLLSNFFTGSSESSCSASSTSASSTSKKYSDYFVEYNGFYILNNIEGELSSERRDRLYFIGQLFAMAIKLRQIIEINLHPLLLYQILHNDFDSITPAKILEIIEKFGLSDTHPFSCFKTPITDINCNYDEMGLEIADKSGEAMNFLKSKMDNPSVKAFISGFRNIINVQITRLNMFPLKEFSKLISGSDIKLDYENLMKHLNFVGFNEVERKAVKDLIKEKSDSDPDWVRAFLFAITNKNKIPISGFPSDKQLRIELKTFAENHPFIVHTCFNTMDLKKSALDEYINSENKTETKLYEYFNIETFKSIADQFNIA